MTRIPPISSSHWIPGLASRFGSKPIPEPALGTFTPRDRTCGLTRYQAFQAQLASRAVGEIFNQAVALSAS